VGREQQCHAVILARKTVVCSTVWHDATMPDDSVIVDATPQHDDGIVAVAVAHDFAGSDTAVDAGYRRFIAAHGRLVVALDGGDVVGFGGAIDADGVRFVTDLFLLPDHQGRGLGGAMLRALVDGWTQRMTFSSAHERAVPSYGRVGMHPRWALQYWSGRSPATTIATQRITEVDRDRWLGDRHDLADLWSAVAGRLLHMHDGQHLTGWAIVLPPADGNAVWTIARLSTALPHEQAITDVLSLIPPGEPVLACVPERSSASRRLQDLGFEVVDRDICCTTDGVDVPNRLAVLHPGLC
jgi:GNAT superfamily N-acetyltransferase